MTTHFVDNLEQARLLADPFKLKLLEYFATEPRTTKQVADLLGEKAPRLYRHVDALFQSGLIKLVEERPKRGTVERYFLTIATRFEMAPQLLSATQGQTGETAELVLSMLREASSDLADLMSQSDPVTDPERAPLVMKVSVSVSPKQVADLRQKLMEWVGECEKLADQKNSEEDEATLVSVNGLVTFYEKSQAQITK